MAESLPRVLARVRALLLDDEALVRAVASGRRRRTMPGWRRAELRYVDLKDGRHLQVTGYDDTQAHTSNHPVGERCAEQVDALLDLPFGSWHVETTRQVHQVRVTKKGAVVSTVDRDPVEPGRDHDRAKPRLLPEGHPVLAAIGIADREGVVKPSRQAKYRQVDEFLRVLASSLDAEMSTGRLREPTEREPLEVVDLGCGNAYLTFAAHAFLADVRGLPVRVTGVDVLASAHRHNAEVASRLGLGESMVFVEGEIATVRVPRRPDIVLSLHACDTATDEALARAVEWQTPLVLAAPCCHHDIAAQLRGSSSPAPYSLLTRSGILRERFADTLTDALRAGLLRQAGYRVDVFAFVESRHTPRNTMLRAVRTGAPASAEERAELEELTWAWRVRPRLGELLEAQSLSTT